MFLEWILIIYIQWWYGDKTVCYVLNELLYNDWKKVGLWCLTPLLTTR